MKKVIEVKDLNFSYEETNFKLEDISFEIYEKEIVGIIGPNGSGKTTLILNLVGILKGEGVIKIFDIPLKKGNLKEIRKRMQVVFQNPDDQLFSPTVFDDVSFGPLNLGLKEDEVIKRVDEALKQIDMIQYKNYFPHHLSFGEKKKISIATVISMKPEIVIFDEPTQGLDPKSRRGIIEIIKKIDGTKIIVSHDFDMVKELCNKIILLNNGKILKIGETDKVLNDKNFLEENGLI
ncbi:MAG: energy-coupling factor ABC transporter ATP-binding protein [Caldisericia bacterium]|nr:energy-coupling factor ABC transporter ATP-binding protein [Caldisericia bacterium]